MPRCFHLCEGSSPLDSTVHQNNMRELWKINPAVSEEHSYMIRDSTTELLETYRRKIDKLSRESSSKLNTIMNYSKGNVFTVPVRRISMNHNVSNVDSMYIGQMDTGNAVYFHIDKSSVVNFTFPLSVKPFLYL